MNDVYLLYNRDDPNLKSKISIFEDALKNGFEDPKENEKRRLPNCIIESSDFLFSHFEDELYFKKKADFVKSKILIAFFDSGFFHNKVCCEFWHSFWEKQVKSSQNHNIQIIFPIILRKEYKPEEYQTDQYKIYEEAKGLGFFHAPADSDDSKVIEMFYDNLVRYIKYGIEVLNSNNKGSTDEDEECTKQLVIVKAIEKLSKNGKIDAKYLSSDIRNKFGISSDQKDIDLIGNVVKKLDTNDYTTTSGKKRTVVCAIYTGGTVGMIRDRSSGILLFRNANPEELLQNLPRLRDLDFDVHLYSYEKTIDSSNADSNKWIEIAEIINRLEKYYQGFVVIHGANTLAYTASSLSFMFPSLNKPIVFTGAELPLSDISREAETNVIKSLSLAAAKNELLIPEVCILYGSNLLRGNRGTKKVSISTVEGFYSPNYQNLGNITTDRKSVNYTLCREKGELFEDIQDSLKADIEIYSVYPDMNMERFNMLCSDSLDALILHTYGTGGVPDDEEKYPFIEIIRRLIENKTIVVSLTQSPIGYVELRLHETNAQLFDIGVINGGDMTTEAAYCKLKYLFAKYGKKTKKQGGGFEYEAMELVGDKMMEDMRGELSMQTIQIRFPEIVKLPKMEEVLVKSKEFNGFDKRNLQAAVLRIRDVRDDSNLSAMLNKVDIDIKIEQNRNVEDFGKWIQHEKLNENLRNINVDVLESVRRFINTSTRENSIKLYLTSKNHSLTYESLSIVLLFGGIG